MQELPEADYATSEQHKDMSDTGIKRSMQDTITILEFMETRDLLNEDSNLRSIVTSVIADNRVNVDKVKEVAQNIHENTEEYTRQTTRPTIARRDSVTYFRPGSCGGKFLSNFQTRKVNCSTLTARNFFGGNFIKIMKTCVNGNTLKLSLLQKWRGDVLVQ